MSACTRSRVARWAPDANKPRSPDSSTTGPPAPPPAKDLLHDLLDPGRIGFQRRDHLLDEGEEVLAHPGDTHELRPMGGLVESHPEAELGGPELMGPLHLEDVRPDERHGITGLSGGQHQLVLAQHPFREEPEQSTGLRTHDGAGRGETPPVPSGPLQSLGQLPLGGGEDRPERCQIAIDPFPSRDDHDLRCTGEAEPGLGCDLLRGAGHGVGEGGGEILQVIGGDERIGACHRPGEPTGHRPRDCRRAHCTTR
jgi:hypothetical protein